MVEIRFFDDINVWLSDVDRHKRLHSRYYVPGNISHQTLAQINQRQLSPIHVPTFDAADEDDFIFQYRDLIGQLSVQQPSDMWWSTDMASKNRFKSKLQEILQEYITIKRVLESGLTQGVVYIYASPSIARVIIDNIAREDMRFILCYPKHQHLVKSVMAWLKPRLGLFVAAFGVARRIKQCQQQLGANHANRLDRFKVTDIVKTFIYDHSFNADGSYVDIFFGKLVPYLQQQSEQLVILGYMLGDEQKALTRIKACQSTVIIPVEYCLTYRDVINAIGEVLTTTLRIDKPLIFAGHRVDGLIRDEWRRTFKGIQIYQRLHYHALKRLLKRINTRSFIYTCENNPWEWMCLLAIKEVSPRTRTIGYQHTVVPQASLNMFPSILEAQPIPMPDKILTVGQVNADTMQHYGHYPQGLIEPFCALRFEYLQQAEVSQRRGEIQHVLLAIEGVLDANPMVAYVINQLALRTDITLVIRTHPTMPWTSFERAFNYNIKQYPHFKLSTNKALKDDLLWSDVVIYWGSTVGIEAMSMGKPIINFKTPAIVNFDPLYNFNEFKWVVRSQDDLSAVINNINQLSDQDFVVKQQRARNFINQYFFPVTDQALNNAAMRWVYS